MANILIGVGGTGAKVVEAALVMLAAGLGPDEVLVGIVDQDNANGNVQRTRELLARLELFRERWGNQAKANLVDWNHAAAPQLGRTIVKPLFESPERTALWCPNLGETTLSAMIGQNLPDEHKQLFDMLFMTGSEEQDLRLSRGYRGRAHVGSAAITAALADGSDIFSERLLDLMKTTVGEVNIFIVGSAFGGTGAAGFPTLARALHRMRNSREVTNGSHVRIGGLLMLPYFSFESPDETTESAVTADELMPKAKMALEYYENLFAHEKTFDRFYALGWNPSIALGYGETGGQGQANPALPPELTGASAALDFLCANWDGAEDDPRLTGVVPCMISSRHSHLIRWKDMPDPRSEARLGQLLRFAAYWRYLLRPQLKEPDGFMRPNWAFRLSDKVNVAEHAADAAALDDLLDDILLWAATIEAKGGRDGWGEGPWTLRPFLNPEHVASPIAPVALRDAMNKTELVDGFDQMIRFDDASAVSRQGGAIYDELTNKPRVDGLHKGIGKAIAATYNAVRVRGD